jgi:predicted O-linked N-acetylglucosamine transferase (SPINDLY family)
MTEDIESYINCAVKLTEDIEYRQDIVKKLKGAKASSPIFKPQLFAKALEQIYKNLI